MRPSILCFSGLDPCGGAGLQADIESIFQCGGHALPIASCLTVQNTLGVSSVSPVKNDLIQQQATAIIEDMEIAACKIGAIANQDTAHIIAEIITDFPSIPVIYDPVLMPTQGQPFADLITLKAIQQTILPKVDIITPNHNELALLTQSSHRSAHTPPLIERIQSLGQLGPKHILLTGADEKSTEVNNLLYNHNTLVETYTWKRLANNYHGSGCTMSSALACFLALGESIQDASLHAQLYTYETLKHAQSLGHGQMIPTRNRVHQ